MDPTHKILRNISSLLFLLIIYYYFYYLFINIKVYILSNNNIYIYIYITSNNITKYYTKVVELIKNK